MDPVNPVAASPIPVNQTPVQEPVPPVQTPIPPIPEASLKPKSKLSLPIIVALVILILALGTVGYLVYKNATSRTLNITTYQDCAKAKGSLIQESFPPVCVTKDGQRFTQEVSSTPTPTPDITANWKIYSNQPFSFEFKCPPTSTHKTVELTTKDGIKFPYSQESCAEGQDQINISIWKIINQEVFTLEGVTKELLGASLQPIDYKETFLGQNKMVTYKEQNLSTQVERSVALIILTDKYIRLDGFSQDYFNQILSTFKFVEQTATPSASPTSTPTSSPSATPTTGV